VCTRYLRGGSERRLRDLMLALPEFEHDVVVGQDSDPALAAAQLQASAISVEPALRREISPANDVRATWRLRRRIRRSRYSLVITHQSKAGVVGRTAAILAGHPPVIHSLSMASFGPGYSRSASGVFRVAERALAPFTAAYAVVGDDLARRYSSIGIPARKLRVVRSGVPLPGPCGRTEARDRVLSRFGLPPGRPLIAYVGSLDERKGATELVPYLALLGSESPRPFLVVAGTGPLQDHVRRSFADAGLADDVALLGYVSPIADLIVAADVVVLLSHAEGISQVLIQAAAAGCPFVATDVDGTHELLAHGAIGAVVPIGDVAAAAAATAALLRDHRRGTPIDTSSWSSDVITAGYRALVGMALQTRRS
jgi:glycosyltransferase involved in cell wall biosynthesis